MAKTISRRYNTLKVGEKFNEGTRTYKVLEVAKQVNATGGTDYVVEETALSKAKNTFVKKQ